MVLGPTSRPNKQAQFGSPPRPKEVETRQEIPRNENGIELKAKMPNYGKMALWHWSQGPWTLKIKSSRPMALNSFANGVEALKPEGHAAISFTFGAEALNPESHTAISFTFGAKALNPEGHAALSFVIGPELNLVALKQRVTPPFPLQLALNSTLWH